MIRTILNATQHKATTEQKEVGVMDLPEIYADQVKDLITFDQVPTVEEIEDRAEEIVETLLNYIESLPFDYPVRGLEIMIGGAPYLMQDLEDALVRKHMIPLYAFSTRVSEDQHQPDGSVKKVQVFKHAGWVRKFS